MADRYWVGGGSATWDNISTANWSAAPAIQISATSNGTTLTTTGSPALAVGMTIWNGGNTNIGTITGGSGNTWTLSGGGASVGPPAATMFAATTGASAPTSADNVFFSNFFATITIGTGAAAPSCLNFTQTTGVVGSSTFIFSATAVLNVYGSWYNDTTNVAFTITNGAQLNFLATTTGKTITTNNLTLGYMNVKLTGIGGGWTLGSAFTTNYFAVRAGAFNTANFAMSVGTLESISTDIRSIALGTSTITLTSSTPLSFSSIANLTFSAASSTIIINGTISTFSGAGLTYGNVTFTNMLLDLNITGANAFNNLNFQSYNSSYGTQNIILDANQVITGTLSFPKSTSAVGNFRYQFKSSARGVARTITAAAIDATTLSNIDFQDIAAAGASAPWPGSSGVNIGDAGGNSGITFRAGRTVYFNSSSNNNQGFNGASTSTPVWALTSGGIPSANYFPLAQDSIVIDDNSAIGIPSFGGAWTGIGFDMYTGGYYVNNVTFSKTATWQFNTSGGLYILGNLSITGGMVSHYSGVNQMSFYIDGTGTSTINLNPTTSPTASNINVYTIGTGTYTYSPSTALTLTLVVHKGGTINVSSGLSCYSFDSSAKTARTLAFGAAGTITTSAVGSTSINISDVTNLTITGNYSFSSFIPPRTTSSSTSGTLNFNSVNDNNATLEDFNALAFDITASSSGVYYPVNGHYKNVSFTNGAIGIGAPLYIHGNLYCDSTSTITYNTSSITNFVSNSTGNTITSSGKTINGSVSFNSSAGTGSWTLLDAFNSTSTVSSSTLTLNGGTLNLNGFACTLYTFISTGTTPRSITSGVSTQVNISAYNTTSSLTIWNTSDPTNLTINSNITFKLSGTSVTTGTRVLLGGAFAEGNAPSISGGASGGTISLGGTSPAWNDLNFTGYSGAFTLAASTKLYGSLTIPSAASTMTGTSYTLTFSGSSGTKTISSGANLLDIGALTFDGGATYQLSAALTCGTSCGVTLTLGTLNLNGFNLTCETFASSNSNVRTLAFGTTGSITCTDITGTTVNFTTSTNLTVTGTAPLITLSQTATTVGRTVYMPAVGESSAISLTVTGGSDAITIRGTSGAYKNLTFSSFTGSMTTANSPIIYGNLTMPATMTTVASTTTLTFGATSGTKTISTNGITIDFPITLSGVGGTFQLSSALTLESTRTLTLTNGTFNSNSFDVTTGIFNSSNSNTRTLDFALSQFYITGSGTAWNVSTATGYTTNYSPFIATIHMMSASAKTFAGGGASFPVLNQAGLGSLTITGSNIFSDLTRSVYGTTITLPASGTTTVDRFSIGGTEVGGYTTLNSSTSGTQANLALTAYTGPTVQTESYMNIRDINFTPSGYFSVSNSINQGNNAGIVFLSTNGMLAFFLGL